MIRRPRLISPPDKITPHQERNLRKRALGEGKHLVHTAQRLGESGGGTLSLRDTTYLLTETIKVGSNTKLIVQDCHFDGTFLKDNQPALFFYSHS